MPNWLYRWLKKINYSIILWRINRYNKWLSLHYSGSFSNSMNAYLASLMVQTHVLEKGITMPNRRVGFGLERVCGIIISCKNAIGRWGSDHIEIQAALADLKQYMDLHNEENYSLPQDVKSGIEELLAYYVPVDDNCFTISAKEYFKKQPDFKEFAYSRHSVRWFDDKPVETNLILKAVELAQTAPSACNRQATRVNIISSDEKKRLCCTLQNGNRGFGDRADKWLLITSELSDWPCDQTDIALIDAGIFIMNLLYSLHYYGIVACTLNAHFDKEKQRALLKGLGIPESEIPVAFVVIGNPTDKFMVPKSRRLIVEDITKII